MRRRTEVHKISTVTCHCKPTDTLTIPRSRGSNVGQISIEAEKDLTALRQGRMYCLTGIGGNVSGIIASTKATKSIIPIEGCSVHHTKKTFEQAVFTPDTHVVDTDLNIEKKSSFLMHVIEIEVVIQKLRGDESEN